MIIEFIFLLFAFDFLLFAINHDDYVEITMNKIVHIEVRKS